MRFTMLALAATVSFTPSAIAQTSPAPTTDNVTPPKEKKTCRRYAVTGSIVGTRAECHTKAEWAAIDARNNRNVDDTLGNARPRGSNPFN